MARYIQIAAMANKIATTLYNEYATTQRTPEELAHFSEQLIRLYNLGIRTSPRACQAVVRERAAVIVANNLPIYVGMTKVNLPNGKSYNALTITPVKSDTSKVIEPRVIDNDADTDE